VWLRGLGSPVAYSVFGNHAARRAWIDHELAARRVPDLAAFEEPQPAPLLRDVAKRWQESCVDVRASTTTQHGIALGRAPGTR
jgi:hypothetical protein